MQFKFTLSENDFLQYYLFTASKSERIIKQKKRSRYLNSILILLMAFFFFSKGDMFLFSYFVIASLVMFFLYPMYMRWHYKKLYKRIVKNTYKENFGKESNISFDETSITTFDETGESKIIITELESISETGEHIFIKVENGSGIIVPKSNVDNLSALKNELQNISEKTNITYQEELDWIWK